MKSGDTPYLAVCPLSCYTILLAPPSIMCREEASPANADGQLSWEITHGDYPWACEMLYVRSSIFYPPSSSVMTILPPPQVHHSNSNQPLAVIFDMDGVLVDSYAAHWQSWHFMADELGKGLTEEQFVSTFGRTSREIIAEHWGPDCLAPAEIAEFDRRKEALYRDIVACDFPAMDGARELLEELRSQGFRLAVGSSGPPENVALAVERLRAEKLLDVLITGRDVTRGKPDPQVFLLAAERLGVAPRDCAVVEDAPVGIAAANSANMTSIALLSTGHTLESVANARLVVRSLRELSADRIARLIGGGVH